MEEITKELLNTIKYIPERERQSKWYLEYLDKIHLDLKNKLNGA
jgi:hypothetical protein